MNHTDLEFQNDAYTLRVAPWLDMARLREELQKNMREGLETNGHMEGYLEMFRDDVEEFCEGKRQRIPRSYETVDIIHNLIFEIFPISVHDESRGNAFAHIFSRLVQQISWSHSNRGGAAKEKEDEEAAAVKMKTDPNIDPSDIDDDDEDCGGCGDCPLCDEW